MKLRDKIIQVHGEHCVYCGSTDNLTIEHLIPMAVIKWTHTDVQCIHSTSNMFMACEQCNKNKGSELPKVDDLKHATYEEKKAYLRNLRNAEYEIWRYKKLKQRIYSKFNGICQQCKGRKPIKCMNIRRIDWDGKRCFDNACIVCRDCQEDFIGDGKLKEGE